MPKSKLSDDDWDIVRQASEAGVDDDALAMDYGVTTTSIRKRRSREKWVTPRAIEAEIIAQKAKKRAMNPMKNNSVTAVTNKTAAELIATQVMEILDRNHLRTAQMADNALRDAADNAPRVKTPADVLTYLKAIRLAAGVDKEGTSVAINLGAIFNAPAEVRPIRCVEVS